MRIVLMGPPGVGKGTQAKRLAEQFGLRHLSSGDMLRAEKANGSELGRRLAQYMDAGELVPDEVVVGVMARALTAGPEDSGILLDGFPRTVAQAEALDAQLADAGGLLDAVVVIDAPREEIIDRITGRRSCPNCGRAYHVKFLPPRREGVCDDCETQLAHREDDTSGVVRRRLKTYDRQTEPVIEYYRNRPDLRVIDIDGGGKPDEVTRSVIEALKACEKQA